MLEKGGDKVTEEGLSVRGCAVEMPIFHSSPGHDEGGGFPDGKGYGSRRFAVYSRKDRTLKGEIRRTRN